jgi:hypothetical protein
MRTECKHFESRTYATGDAVRKCNLDKAPDAPWRCPEPCDGYDLLTGTQVVELLVSIDKSEARNILEYECTHRNRAVVIAAAQSVITPQ